jgi:hypothetical protein
MKYSILTVLLLMVANYSFSQRASSVDVLPSFEHAYPDGQVVFDAFEFTVFDSSAYINTKGFSGPGESFDALMFVVSISPNGGVIEGYNKKGMLKFYKTIDKLLLDNISMLEDGTVKYYYCCRCCWKKHG